MSAYADLRKQSWIPRRRRLFSERHALVQIVEEVLEEHHCVDRLGRRVRGFGCSIGTIINTRLPSAEDRQASWGRQERSWLARLEAFSPRTCHPLPCN